MEQGEQLPIHLSSGNVYGLFGLERRNGIQAGGNRHVDYFAYNEDASTIEEIFIYVAAYRIASAVELSRK